MTVQMFEYETFQQKSKVIRSLLFYSYIIGHKNLMWDNPPLSAKDAVTACLSLFPSAARRSFVVKNQVKVISSLFWRELDISVIRNQLLPESPAVTAIVLDYVATSLCDLNTYIYGCLSKTSFVTLRQCVNDIGEYYATLAKESLPQHEISYLSTVLYLRLSKSIMDKWPGNEHWSQGKRIPDKKWSVRDLMKVQRTRV